MGNSNKKPEEYDVVRSYRPEEWINKQKRTGYEIWQNVSRNIRADVYPVTSQIKAADLQHYEMRHNNSQDIVKVHHLRMDKQPSLCSKSADAHVFVQRIPYRLTDVIDLSQPEALSVLRSAYSGFNTISTFYGPVQPYEDMICFNQQGKPKVWINSNLALNKLQQQNRVNSKRDSANVNQGFINKIFDMVQHRTVGRALPQNLRNKFRQQSPRTYFQALNSIQQYASQNGLMIPPVVSARGGHGINQNLMNQSLNSTSRVQSYNYINGNGQGGNVGNVQSANTLYNSHHQSQPQQLSSQSRTQSQLQQLPQYYSQSQSQTLPVGLSPIVQSSVLSSNQAMRATMPAPQSLFGFAGGQKTLTRKGSQKSFSGRPAQVSQYQPGLANTVSNVVFNRPSVSAIPSMPHPIPLGTIARPMNSTYTHPQQINNSSRVNNGSHKIITIPTSPNTAKFGSTPAPTHIRFQSPSKVVHNQVYKQQYNPAPVYQSINQQVHLQPQQVQSQTQGGNKQSESPIKSVAESPQKPILITKQQIQQFEKKQVSAQQRASVEQMRIKQETAPQSQTGQVTATVQQNLRQTINTQQLTGQVHPQIQIQRQTQIQPSFAMPLSPQFKYGFSNQPHQINYSLFSNNQNRTVQSSVPTQQIQQGAIMAGQLIQPRVQQQIQMSYYAQQSQQTQYAGGQQRVQLVDGMKGNAPIAGQQAQLVQQVQQTERQQSQEKTLQAQPQQLEQSVQIQRTSGQQQQPKYQQVQQNRNLTAQEHNLRQTYSEQNDRQYQQDRQGQKEMDEFADEVERNLYKLEQDKMYDNYNQENQYSRQQGRPETAQQRGQYQQTQTQQQLRVQRKQSSSSQKQQQRTQQQPVQVKQKQSIQSIQSHQIQTSQEYRPEYQYEEEDREEDVQQEVQQYQRQQQKQVQSKQSQQQSVQRQQQKQQLSSQQNNESNSYFPFSATNQNNFSIQQIKRVATMEIKQGDMPKNQSRQNSPRRQLEEIKQKTQESEIQVEQTHHQRQSPQLQQGGQNQQSGQNQQQNVASYSNPWQVQNQEGERITSSYGYEYQYKRKSYQPEPVAGDKIPENARYQDIENYIRNKYKAVIGVSQQSDFRPSSSVTPYSARDNQYVDVKDMANYVQSKYDQYSANNNQNYNNNQDINFSFRPSKPVEDMSKPPLPPVTAGTTNYDYMRVEHDYNKYHQDSPSQVKAQEERRFSGNKEVKKEQKGGDDADMLDVGYLERSLDKKYSSIKSQQQIKGSESNKKEDTGFQFDVAKLQQNLVRFEESRVGSGAQVNQQRASNSSQLRFQTSQVSKINSIDYRLGHQRRSSVHKGFNINQLNNYSPQSYQNQSPIYQFDKKASARISKDYSSIDDKFNKYVNNNKMSSSNSSKAILKPKQQNYDSDIYNNYNYDSSSRMATGHFGYTEGSKQGGYSGGNAKGYKTSNYEGKKTTFVTSEVTNPKGLSYEDLRKFMWS